jgi:O-antigen/teichoic acid export membrane protein
MVDSAGHGSDAVPELPAKTADTAGGTRRARLGRLTRSDVSRRVASTAAYNVAIVAAGSLSGLIIARYLGPTKRGDYAAVTTWFAAVATIAEFGQPAAICYYISSEPARARE